MEERRAARIEAAKQRLGELEDELTAARAELMLANLNIDMAAEEVRSANAAQRWKQDQTNAQKEHLRGTTTAISAKLYRHLDFTEMHLNHIIDLERVMIDENGDPKNPQFWYSEVIKDVARVIQIFTNLSITLAVQGVHNKAISRKHAADLLGVHQATVARWAKGQLPETYKDDPAPTSTKVQKATTEVEQTAIEVQHS